MCASCAHKQSSCTEGCTHARKVPMLTKRAYAHALTISVHGELVINYVKPTSAKYPTILLLPFSIPQLLSRARKLSRSQIFHIHMPTVLLGVLDLLLPDKILSQPIGQSFSGFFVVHSFPIPQISIISWLFSPILFPFPVSKAKS